MTARDAVRHLPLVKSIARGLAARIQSPVVDVDDLVQYGMLGLFDAISKFDPARHAKLTTYAAIRIRGAMLDGVRALDRQPSSLRRRAREVEATIGDLEAGLGRAATAGEIAARLGVAMPEWQRLRARIAAAQDGAPLEDRLVAAPPSADPAAQAERDEVRRVVRRHCEALPADERLVLLLHHWEEVTLKDIADVLGVTPGRISQLHTKACLALHASLTRAGMAAR